mgnify:CR=1 FL=1
MFVYNALKIIERKNVYTHTKKKTILSLVFSIYGKNDDIHDQMLREILK